MTTSKKEQQEKIREAEKTSDEITSTGPHPSTGPLPDYKHDTKVKTEEK